MDRDQFETALDALIQTYDRKVCAAIDAGNCRTQRDWRKAHETDEAYLDARDAFLDKVFAPPPAAPPPIAVVIGREEQDSRRTHGKPLIWHRGVEIRIASKGILYKFAADADSLTLDPIAVKAGDSSYLHSPDFDPLRSGHSIHFRGIDYSTTERGPEVLVKVAIEACRAVALRLHAHGIDYFAAMQAWPKGLPAFADLVKGEVPQAAAA